MLRRIILVKFLIVLCAGFILSAQTEDRPLVVASASMFADMAEVIGGNLIDIKMIVPVGGDPHIYE